MQTITIVRFQWLSIILGTLFWSDDIILNDQRDLRKPCGTWSVTGYVYRTVACLQICHIVNLKMLTHNTTYTQTHLHLLYVLWPFTHPKMQMCVTLWEISLDVCVYVSLPIRWSDVEHFCKVLFCPSENYLVYLVLGLIGHCWNSFGQLLYIWYTYIYTFHIFAFLFCKIHFVWIVSNYRYHYRLCIKHVTKHNCVIFSRYISSSTTFAMTDSNMVNVKLKIWCFW